MSLIMKKADVYSQYEQQDTVEKHAPLVKHIACHLREIGAVIGVSESRVSQIHSQAIIRLQARLSSTISE